MHIERCELTIFAAHVGGNFVMQVEGVLDPWTYRQMRDAIVKAALDEPNALIIDVDKLEVNDTAVWSVFTSSRQARPGAEVPILLVCGDIVTQRQLERMSVTRYVPVFSTIREAREAVSNSDFSSTRRIRVALPTDASSVALAGGFIRSELTAWSLTACIPAVSIVATLLVDNAIKHGCGDYSMRLEADDTAVKVAVEDGSAVEAVRRPAGGRSGLDVVAKLSTAWGNIVSPTGKTVWARVAMQQRVDQLTG